MKWRGKEAVQSDPVFSIYERRVLNERQPVARKVGSRIRVQVPNAKARARVGQSAHLFIWNADGEQSIWMHTANAVITAVYTNELTAEITEFLYERELVTVNENTRKQMILSIAASAYRRQGRGGQG